MTESIVITYGTFDLFHIGHLNILERCKALGNKLFVGVSTDEFNRLKGKSTLVTFEERVRIVEALKCVDGVFPENSWDQKPDDIKRMGATRFVMGSDWAGKFDFLDQYCQVVYLDRTPDISSTQIKEALNVLQTLNSSRS